MNTFNAEELEMLAAGYVLDDLDEAEKLQVEELLKSSPAMREQIRQSMELMGGLATNAELLVPPTGLKDKVVLAFESQQESLLVSSKKKLVQLDNWLQHLFDEGWQAVTDLLETPSMAPAFRNSGVEGARLVSFGAEQPPIVLVVKVQETSVSDRDVAVEILPQLEASFLPNSLQLTLLDADGDIVMEATTRQENKNLKFDFSGICGEVFSIKLELANDFFQENFLL